MLAEPGDDVSARAGRAGRPGRARRQAAARPRPQRPARAGPGTSPARARPRSSARCCPRARSSSDEANTSGLWLPGATAGAPPHDWLTLTGGAIGQGLPLAAGAAIACPDRPVLALEADGSAMYTISALWTQAREGLDVTTVIFSNRSYAILDMELDRVGAVGRGRAARSLLDLSRPDLDFVALATGHGRPGQPGRHRGRVRRPAAAGARGAGTAPDRGRGPAARLTAGQPGRSSATLRSSRSSSPSRSAMSRSVRPCRSRWSNAMAASRSRRNKASPASVSSTR